MAEWINAKHEVPYNKPLLWSNEVIALSDTGDVFKLACMGGYWQRTQEFLDSGSTKIIGWMPLPEPPQD